MRELGRGAFGCVFHVQDERARHFAVKRVKVRDAPHEAKLLQEALSMGRVRDLRHVLLLHEWFAVAEGEGEGEGAEGGRSVCFVTEYCSRGDLNALIKERPQWAEKGRCSLPLPLPLSPSLPRSGACSLRR